MTQAVQLMTAEDLWKLGNGERRELVKGELRTMPPSGGEHGFVTVNVTTPLATFVRTNRLGVVLGADAGFILARNPDTVRGADVSFVRAENIPATGIPRGFWPGVPDLAVEVISPGDTYGEVEDKVNEWLQAGCQMVWAVNPRNQTVTVHRLQSDITVLTRNEFLDGQDVVPGFRCRVADVFS